MSASSIRAKLWREKQKADPEKWEALKDAERAKYRRNKYLKKCLVNDLSPQKQAKLREKWRKRQRDARSRKKVSFLAV